MCVGFCERILGEFLLGIERAGIVAGVIVVGRICKAREFRACEGIAQFPFSFFLESPQSCFSRLVSFVDARHFHEEFIACLSCSGEFFAEVCEFFFEGMYELSFGGEGFGSFDELYDLLIIGFDFEQRAPSL